MTSTDLRCNAGGLSGAGVATVSLAAGSSYTWHSDIAVYHQGPVSFYMAKAPSTAATYDGSGVAWFKTAEIGPTFSNGQATWDLART